MIKLIATGFFLLTVAASYASAQVAQYTDRAGRKHFVSAPEKVPAEYRDQLQNSRELPPISRYTPQVVAPPKPSPSDSYSAAASEKNAKVEIFVTSWCTYCKQLESFLRSKRVDYVRHDIEKSAAARMMYEALGGGGFPITRIGSTIIQGFDQAEIESALKASKKL